MVNVTEKWNRKLMSPNRDSSMNSQPSRFYSILSVPRSGSTLLSRGLEATGRLGVPLEYLNQNAIDAWKFFQDHTEIDISDYLLDIYRRRTSEDGWFGIKVHYRHFAHHYGTDAFEMALKHVRMQNKRILITRNDQVAQAVSYYRARVTGMWSSEHMDYLDQNSLPVIPYDFPAMAGCLDEIRYGEDMWLRVLRESNVEYLHVTFEDLTSNYFSTMASVLQYLDLDNFQVPSAQIASVSVGHRDDLEAQFRLAIQQSSEQ